MTTDLETFGCYIDGRDVASGDITEQLLVPATGEPWGVVHYSTALAVEAVAAADRAFGEASWARLGGTARAVLMRRLASAALEHRAEFARNEALATGKTVAVTRGEADGLARHLDYFAGLAEDPSGRLIDLDPDTEVRVVHEPVGVVVAILPFNGPLSLGSWKIAPALAAGNTLVIKPPQQGAASLLLMARLATEVGFPPGVINVVPGGAEVGEMLIDQPQVALVSFTGSTAVAAHLAARVAGQMKRFVCEAGGKSAQLVFADADLDSALAGVAQGIFANAGQTCVAGSRLLVQDEVYDAFVERLTERARRLVVGDPAQAGTDVGPLASKRQFERVSGMVARALGEGARAVVGGQPARLGGALAGGYFFQPTILVDVAEDQEVWREEVFGPVLAVERFSDEQEAVRMANSSDYGLAAGIWTTDLRRAHRVSRALQAGTVWVNTYRRMDRRVPFGGYKKSGFGRENGREALAEFCNVKSIVADYGAQVDNFPSARALPGAQAASEAGSAAAVSRA